jgi:hypothetical protein
VIGRVVSSGNQVDNKAFRISPTTDMIVRHQRKHVNFMDDERPGRIGLGFSVVVVRRSEIFFFFVANRSSSSIFGC